MPARSNASGAPSVAAAPRAGLSSAAAAARAMPAARAPWRSAASRTTLSDSRYVASSDSRTCAFRSSQSKNCASGRM